MEITGNLVGKGLARIRIQGDRISSIQIDGPTDSLSPYISLGFVDIQLNGFGGIDFCDRNLDPADVPRILHGIWKTGVTTFCPTIISNSHDSLVRNFRILEEARRISPWFALSAPCYHLEGPYISSGPSHGAHNPNFARNPDWDEFVELQDIANGNIGIVTLAPELHGATDFIRRARESGVVVGLGHTEATAIQIHEAVEAGACLSTHLGNGNPQMIDRHQNTLWPQMANPKLSASLICDGFHLPPDLLQVIFLTKGIDGCILITDAVYVAGMPPGHYSLVGMDIELLRNGQVVTADGRCMAGSALSMDRAISLFMQVSGVELSNALQAATVNPARLLHGLEVSHELAEGQIANLTLFRIEDSALNIESVILKGHPIYSHGKVLVEDMRLC